MVQVHLSTKCILLSVYHQNGKESLDCSHMPEVLRRDFQDLRHIPTVNVIGIDAVIAGITGKEQFRLKTIVFWESGNFMTVL